MSTRVLFIQGGGEGTHDNWDGPLADSLQRNLGENYAVMFPNMPDEAKPGVSRWTKAIREHFLELQDGDHLVGHSLGGLMLLNAVAEGPPPFSPGGLYLLAAPYIGDGGWPADGVPSVTSLASKLPTGLPIHLYHGTADDTVPFEHARLFEQALPDSVLTVIEDGDHQFGDVLQCVAQDILRPSQHR